MNDNDSGVEKGAEEDIRILPSLLAADFSRLAQQSREALAENVFGLHADVMDGRFVPPITFGALVLRDLIRATGAWVDAHLMIVEPERQIEAFAEAGVKAITIHSEASHHLHRHLAMIREAGCEAGVALNPATPVTEVLRYTLPLLDRVLVMTVNPGWGGQKLIRRTLDKVHTVRRILNASDSEARLQVDGGVDAAYTAELVRLGATELVAGTAVFRGDIRENIKRLKKAIAEGLKPR